MIIGISELHVSCIIGCLAHEREAPQPLIIDLRMTTAAPTEDSLQHTIDYVAVSHVIEHTLQNRKFQLLETAAQSLVQELFTQFPRVSHLWIKIEKPGAIPYAKSSFVEYER